MKPAAGTSAGIIRVGRELEYLRELPGESLDQLLLFFGERYLDRLARTAHTVLREKRTKPKQMGTCAGPEGFRLCI